MTHQQVATQVSRTLTRRAAVPALVGDHRDFLLVTGLGGPSRDIAALTGDSSNLYALGGAMGAATMVGLGLALARPEDRVLVVTGDGEMLMNVGALATVGVLDPPNLSIVCIDNGHYGETGNQLSHTGRGVDLEAIARGAGISLAMTVNSEADISEGRELIRAKDHASFVLLTVDESDPPPAKRSMDGAANRVRFRSALLG